MDKPWKLVLLLVGIFAAGVVTGGFVSLRLGRGARERPRFDQTGANRLKNLTERLDLTTEQQDKLRPVVQRDTEDLNRIRSTSVAETRRILDRMAHDVSEVLTPEQRTKFDQMNKEMREHIQRIMKERGPGGMRPGRDGGPEGPPPEPPGDKPPEKPPGN